MDLLLQFPLLCLPLPPLLYLLPKIIKNNSRFSRPSPLGLPFIGNLHLINPSSLHTSLWQLSKSYGPIVFINFGFIPAIVVSSANLAKEVLKPQDLIFCSRPSLLGVSKVTYNAHNVIFSAYNKNWREMRKIFVLHLLGPKRVPSFRHIREDEVSSAMKNIHGLALSSKHVNLSELMKSVTSNMMLRVGCGKRYQDGHERKVVLRLITEVQTVSVDFIVSNLWPGLPFVALVDRLLGKVDRVEKYFQYFDSFYQQLIDEHLNPQKLKLHEEEEDFKEQLFDLTYDHIKAILMNVLIAGTDTTATIVVGQ
ncbi:cytochrome P450 [Cynara cardunculus var. scolymus]|uniref:Cytochrome P450 n=1 Tax=Cynara cardunculus var. scolymus TaxID=59895 RepID=A0A103YCE8_CYNCS|nr:cytochrome P450 [Cynara cardunculus var. scolymus]